MWYEFNQNNSGGSFTVDDQVCHVLYIEADSVNEANHKAIDKGVYFNGFENGIDCYCCGDRWDQGEPLEFPLVYSPELSFQNIEELADYLSIGSNMSLTYIARFFYADGTVKEISRKKGK